jgi:flagellar biosynthesis protein FlhA
MADLTNNPTLPAWLNRLDKYRPLLVPVAVIGLIAVIVVPLPPFVMDMLIASNIALAALILMTTIFVKSPLEFSVFPSLLLGTTLFRLVLNIATTRLILAADVSSPGEATAVAGKVIQSFADFVAGSSVVVGVILFAILIIVQFVVITKGATRISEVAARFTLDGMPGKQMAIDADLNAGIIDEQSARNRREEIGREADFYGAMDGAAKFVRGDAVAGIIITIVNILGGFAVGVWMKGWSLAESIEVFTLLTIGDGLVSQLPAFVVSIGAALIVTRSGSRRDFGQELTEQLTARAAAMGVTSAFLVAMAFTGLPTVPMLALGMVCGTMAFFAGRQEKVKRDSAATEKQKSEAAEPPPIEQSLGVDTLELEVGYGLVRMVDAKQGGDLLERITLIRRQLAAEQGFVMPPVRIRDNMQLQPNDYHLKIRGNSIASGQVYPGQFLAMDGGLASPDSKQLDGVRVKEPAFGLDAVWIDAGQKQRAETLNYTVVDATSVLATHITELVKTHAHELLDFEETNNLIAQLKEKSPKLAAAVLEASGGNETPMVKTSELQKVLQNLLRERVPIRDLATVVETLGEWASRTKDLDVLTEYVRNALRRTICGQHTVEEPIGDDPGLVHGPMAQKMYCVSLDPALEDQITGYISRSAEGTSMSMPPSVANRITAAILQETQRLIHAGHNPVVLASPQVRAQVRQLIEPHLPNCAVLGYNEVSKGVEVESLGLVQSSPDGNPEASLQTPMTDSAFDPASTAGEPALQGAGL